MHRTVTGDKNWIYFKNPKRKESWVDPDAPSTSTARPNRFVIKTILCVWWDQSGVMYYELLKPLETINTKRYQQQLTNLNCSLFEKKPEYQKKQYKIIFLHDSVRLHTTKSARVTWKTLSWKVLLHATHSPDSTSSDYHLLASMHHALAAQRFDSYEDVKK